MSTRVQKPIHERSASSRRSRRDSVDSISDSSFSNSPDEGSRRGRRQREWIQPDLKFQPTYAAPPRGQQRRTGKRLGVVTSSIEQLHVLLATYRDAGTWVRGLLFILLVLSSLACLVEALVLVLAIDMCSMSKEEATAIGSDETRVVMSYVIIAIAIVIFLVLVFYGVSIFWKQRSREDYQYKRAQQTRGAKGHQIRPIFGDTWDAADFNYLS